MRSTISVAIAAFGLAIASTGFSAHADSGLASMHDWQRVGGKICMADHFHEGSSGIFASKAQAQAEAIRSWSDFTDLEYGSAWARFNAAASKSIKCSPADGSKWTCMVEARPCRIGYGKK